MEISQSYKFENILYNQNTKINATIDVINDKYYQLTYIYGNNNNPTKESEVLKYVNKDLLVKNELTQKMMDYLLMDDSELCKVTGTITPKDYKKSILLSLANFID
tara:strand:+ start:378 stop:692 length:315 start_codon:yes stop_codon:yes gene_type:complete